MKVRRLKNTVRIVFPYILAFAAGSMAEFAESAEASARTPGALRGPALTIEASAAPVLIERGTAGRRQLILPDIEIEATLQVRCRPGSAPAAVSLMSADTRVQAPALADGEAKEVALELAVPAAQLPPVYARDFCIEGEPGRPALVKPALVSLQGSLRCSAPPHPDNPDTDDTPATARPDDLARASAAVDVELRCKPEPDESGGGSERPRETAVGLN